MSTRRENRHSRRFTGLDGLRAVAVVLVVSYHLFPSLGLEAGYIGVDVFFVISGFLITSLLLRRTTHGLSGIADFWRRRARRLLPALALTIMVCASAAWVIGGDVLVRLGTQVLGAFTFSYNWAAVLTGSGYFEATGPELLRNFWSLAVEEQFYLVWPLLLPLVLLLPRGWPRAMIALAGAVASAAWMFVLLQQGADTTRIYFGTDTHAFGILFGVALAFLLERIPDGEGRRSAAVRWIGAALGTTALAGIVLLAFIGTEEPDALPTVLVAATVLTGILVVTAVWPGSLFGRMLDLAPLKWVGDRSYGLYLWHWPILVLVLVATQGTGPEATVPLWAGTLSLILTVICAALSYRLVEEPVRRKGFRGAFAAAGSTFRRSAWGAATVGASAVCVLALATGTAVAAVTGPAQTSAAESISDGQDVLDQQQPGPSPTATEKLPSPTPTASSTPSSSPAPPPSPTPTPVEGSQITAVGDSVMLASAPALVERFPGIDVDAEVSRSIWVGPEIVRSLADSGQLREYVVIALGTNGPVETTPLDEMLEAIGPDRHLVLVTASAPREWIPEVNETLTAFASAHPERVDLADWSHTADEDPGLLAGDRIHPSAEGGKKFTTLVAEAIRAAS
ncbi:MAG: acyltransferase family protein [Microbacterium sp.]